MNNKLYYLDRFLDNLNRNNSKYEYIGGYVNDNSKVKLRCKDCGDTFERYASSVRSGKEFRCFNCERLARSKTKEEREKAKDKKIIDRQLGSIQLSFLVCKHCGKLFIPINNKTTFCSKRCRQRHNEHQKNSKELTELNKMAK